MKLRNKKTGEIKDVQLGNHNDPSDGIIVVYSENGEPREPHEQYNSLAELNEDWEDYEEPKEYWYIDPEGGIYPMSLKSESPEDTEACKQIGNYFETKEEAEKAVEKLKAWKRLRDKGFRFTGHFLGAEGLNIHYECIMKYDISDDLDLLFGGEE